MRAIVIDNACFKISSCPKSHEHLHFFVYADFFVRLQNCVT